MNPGIFEFQSMMTSVVNGISGSLLTAVQSVAYTLMTICLVLGIYEAYVKGGDIRSLAATFLKYAVAAFVIGYWSNFFSDLFTGFNQIANTIDSSYGAGDLAANWLNGLKALWTSQGYDSIFNGIAFSPSAILTVLEIFLAYVIYPIAVQIFALIYTFWGSCLFAMGPLVIALAPSAVVNSLTKYYTLNLAVWNAWTVIYAVFACLDNCDTRQRRQRSCEWESHRVRSSEPGIWRIGWGHRNGRPNQHHLCRLHPLDSDGGGLHPSRAVFSRRGGLSHGRFQSREWRNWRSEGRRGARASGRGWRSSRRGRTGIYGCRHQCSVRDRYRRWGWTGWKWRRNIQHSSAQHASAEQPDQGLMKRRGRV